MSDRFQEILREGEKERSQIIESFRRSMKEIESRREESYQQQVAHHRRQVARDLALICLGILLLTVAAASAVHLSR